MEKFSKHSRVYKVIKIKIPRKSRREDLYSAWKPAHLKDKIKQLKKGEIITPTHIQVDLTGRCNHDCMMCFYRNAGFKHLEFVPYEEIPLDVGTRLFDQMADLGIRALELTGGGEPLIYPKIRECLDRISKRELELALVTNGSLLTEDILDRITNPKWIRVSMEAATEETRRKIHRSPRGEFEQTLKNLQRIVDRKFDDCKIGVSFIIQPENYHEIIQAARLYKKIGVDNIRFSYAFTSKYDKLLTPAQRKAVSLALSEAKKYEDKNYRVFIMEGRLDDFAPREKTFDYCGYQMFTFQIGCDSLVYPCCILKYYKQYAFGDIRKQSLGEIIFGEQRRKYLEEFNVDKCLPCWLRGRNEFIEYLLIEDAPHKYFV